MVTSAGGPPAPRPATRPPRRPRARFRHRNHLTVDDRHRPGCRLRVPPVRPAVPPFDSPAAPSDASLACFCGDLFGRQVLVGYRVVGRRQVAGPQRHVTGWLHGAFQRLREISWRALQHRSVLARTRRRGGVLPFAMFLNGSTKYCGLSHTVTALVRLFAVSVHVIFCVPKSFGTVMANTPYCRRGRKCVGWPRSGPPGSMRLFGPIGTSSV